MPGDDGVEGVGNADQGLIDFDIRVAHGLEQGSMGGSFDSLFDEIAFHEDGFLLPVLQKKIRYRLWGLITDFVFCGLVFFRPLSSPFLVAADYLDYEDNNNANKENVDGEHIFHGN
jgi:hypothetical protein